MLVLMIGATGRYAGLVVPALKSRGLRVRALVRTREGEELARRRGADETVLGDLQEPRCIISAAVGADGVFHIGPAFAPRETEMGITMVKASRAAGVRKFVYSSVMHPSMSKFSNHVAKRPVEETLYDSGMTFTVLQPAIFMQTLENVWQSVVETGQFAMPYSRRVRSCYVDYRDVAEAAARAFTGDKLDNGTFELSSAGMYSRIDIASMMGDALGRRIEATEVSFDEWSTRIAKLTLSHVRLGMERMFADYDRYGFPGGNSTVLRDILGREPRTLRQFFQELTSPQRKAA